MGHQDQHHHLPLYRQISRKLEKLETVIERVKFLGLCLKHKVNRNNLRINPLKAFANMSEKN